jgi:hypothetical protein
MPYLRFKGFEKDFVEFISPMIIDEFSIIATVPKEIVKIELLNVERIANSPLSVEILMFQRMNEIHDEIAKKIHKILSEYGFKQTHIFFVILTPSFYYKEGLPLKN